VRQSIWWHVIYLSNFYFATRGEYLGDVSHFWSLAVEEQFYFVWPFLICMIPSRHTKYFIYGGILAGPVFRFCLEFLFNASETAVNVLPISSLDALSMGAMLALIKREPQPKKYEQRAMILALISAAGFVLVKYVISVPEQFYPHAIFAGRLLLIPCLLGGVILVSQRVKGLAGDFLEWRPLTHIGKISYGIYLFHFFIPWAVTATCGLLGFSAQEIFGYPLLLMINVVVLLALSSLSWLYFESPINNLKRHFSYESPQQVSKPYLQTRNYLKLLFSLKSKV
jgi:peptidoglycan/LPS O-acetylase OafA/YrhL